MLNNKEEKLVESRREGLEKYLKVRIVIFYNRCKTLELRMLKIALHIYIY